jgi:alanine dehydrogenase
MVDDPEDVWAADLVCKVKEPQPSEWRHFHSGLRLFCYLHLAAEPLLTAALNDACVEGHAFETVSIAGRLPLLAPMSEIAGRAAAIAGATWLAADSGLLVGGATGVPPAQVIAIGLGMAGTMAARGLRGLDANVVGVDVDLNRLYCARQEGVVNSTLASNSSYLAEEIAKSDLVIGSALVPGARSPCVVTSDMVASMRQGSVIVDLAIDQGGCVETSRPTTLSDPTFLEHGVLHYCVTNVPGQYPRTATRALSAALAPRVRQLAVDPSHDSLSGSLNVRRGQVVHPALLKEGLNGVP